MIIMKGKTNLIKINEKLLNLVGAREENRFAGGGTGYYVFAFLD